MVLLDGSVFGTWTHTVAKNALRVTVEPFCPLSSKVTGQIRKRAQDLARAMDLSKAEVSLS